MCQQRESCRYVCVIASEYPARLADKQVKRLGSQEPVCISEGETPGGFGYQRQQGRSRPTPGEIMRSRGVNGEICLHVCVCVHARETTGENKDPEAATELTCTHCEYMLSLATGWTWWHGPVAALPLLGYQILQFPTRSNIRKEP